MKKPKPKRRISRGTTSEPKPAKPINTNFDFGQKESVEDNRAVIFKPNPGPQEIFLSASEIQVLYGGAAGGGKSYAILADPVRDFVNPHFRGLILRRTTEELRELIDKSRELYPQAIPKARFDKRDSTWYFPNGGSLWMSFLERNEDTLRYQGQAYNYIAFDELTQWPTPYAWNYMASRLRTSSDTGLKLYMRATTNPGGPGHGWVKKMFIDPAPAGKAFWATDVETGQTLVEPDYKEMNGRRLPNPNAGQPLFKRRFIPARLSDNPYLYNGGEYERMLLSLPETERKKLLEGDWDIAEGAAFTEWNRAIHVVEPFEIPRNWRRFRSCDYGYGSYSAVLWFAVTPWDQLVVYRELYVHKMLAVDLADKIIEIEREDGPVSYGVLDSSVWYKRGDPGPSLAEQMISRGCKWRPSDRSAGSRIAGKNEVHRRLQVDEYTGEPRIIFFNNCSDIIAQLPVLPLDKKNPEDVDTNSEDHLYDALRYGVMSRPRFASNYTSNNHYIAADNTFGY